VFCVRHIVRSIADDSQSRPGVVAAILWVVSPLLTLGHDVVAWLVALLPQHPGPYAAIKRLLLNWAGARVGRNVHIYPGVRIYMPRGLVVGNNVSISSYVVITTAGTVTIGDNVLIGYGTRILSANHKIPDSLGVIFGAGHDCKPVVIEDGVWLGANVVILPGVRVREGAVVAAGAVVTKDIDPYTVVGGVPAELIRNRS